MKKTIRNSIEDAIDEDPNSFMEKINDVLGAKLADALQTKDPQALSNSA